MKKSDISLLIAGFIVFLLYCQFLFWYNTEKIKPDMIITPEPPKELVVKALSFGDEQFYFRTLNFKIQNSGDTFGRFTPLSKYNFEKLYNWFLLMDLLDKRSNFVPAIASYYFGLTQNNKDVIYVINYLRQHVKSDPEKKWWWLVQAVYLANNRLKDQDVALEVAYELANLPQSIKMPMWARQMPAFIHEQRGEYGEAYHIIINILDNYENLTDDEKYFMNYFIKERIDKIKEFEESNSNIVDYGDDDFDHFDY